jgi:uncharacterized protein (TIGR01777 family)
MAVVHLAGEPVAQRWTPEVQRRIRESRVLGTRNLVAALGRVPTPPRVLVAASAVGYYGDRGDEILTESSAPGNDFLARTCVEWENESRRAAEFGATVTALRAGIVLGREGGALATMAPPFRAGVGGHVGSGRHWVSWIHLDDMVEMILWALRNEQAQGAFNASAPNPVRNSEFARELGHALHRPSLVPVPAFGLKLLYGKMADVILSSQRVIPEAASRAGFSFRYTNVSEALLQIFT